MVLMFWLQSMNGCFAQNVVLHHVFISYNYSIYSLAGLAFLAGLSWISVLDGVCVPITNFRTHQTSLTDGAYWRLILGVCVENTLDKTRQEFLVEERCNKMIQY